MSKPAVKSLSLLLAAVVAFYWKIVFTRQFSMVTDPETISQAYSWFHFWAESIRHGVWPLWDPYMFGGRSYAGEMQTAAFYPLHLVFALFGGDRDGLLPEWLFHGYFILAHALAAVSMFALVRELKLSYFAAVVGGLCFSIGGFVGQVPWPHLLESASWTPLLFLLFLRALHAAEWRRAMVQAALAGLVMGLSILAGGLHIVFMQAILLAAAGVYQAAGQRRAAGSEAGGTGRPETRLAGAAGGTGGPETRFAAWSRPLAAVGVALAIGLLAGAVQLAPSVEYSAHAMRFLGAAGAIPASQRIAFADLDTVPPRVLAAYLFFSNPQGTMDGHEVLDPYPGVFTLLLAIIGFWKCRDKAHGGRWVRFALGLTVAAFLYSLGQASWLYGMMYALVPFLWMAREAGRFLFLAHFGLVILAAFGCDYFFSAAQKLEDWSPLNRIFLCVVAACGLALAAPAVLGTPALKPLSETSLLMIVLTYPLFRWIAGGATGLAPRVLTVALIVFNLSAFSFISPNKIQVARTGTDYSERLRGLRGVVDFLRRQPGPFRVRVLADPPLNIGDAYGIETLNGGAVTLANNFLDLMNKSSAGARLLNTRYILRPAAATEPNPAYADGSWKVYEDPQALPRAWVVHEATVEPSHDRLLERLGAPDMDLTRRVLVSAPLDIRLEPAVAGAAEQAAVTAHTAQHIEIKAHAPARGLLVLSELYYPGWRARVNGRPARIYEADGGLRSVIVPQGDSTVALDYAPASVRVGAALSGLALLGVLLAGLAFNAGRPGRVR